MKRQGHFNSRARLDDLSALTAVAMNVPIFQSGDSAPPLWYRDIGNGVELRLGRDSVLPLDSNGCIAIYVPLGSRRSKRALVEQNNARTLEFVDGLVEERLALYERTENGV